MQYITNNRIDLLQFVPKKTISGFDINVYKFNRGKEEWLKIWYKHPRIKPFEIKRFVDSDILGSLLGQLQAEGTKNKKFGRIEFKNKLIEEHKEFILSLRKLGIKNKINCRFLYNPNRCHISLVNLLVKNFEKRIGIKSEITKTESRGIGFETKVRSTIFTEILLNAMNSMRKQMVIKFASIPRNFSEAFFNKLLTGDGTIDIGKRKVPQISIKIVDMSLEYLKDYKIIMKRLGFKPKINKKYILVKSSCSFENLIYLYKIKAFKNSNNWKKLILTIGLLLEGRRLNTNYRFIDLINRRFTGFELKKKYKITLRAANDWLNNKEKEGLIKRVQLTRPIRWKLIKKAENLAKILIEWKKDLDRIKEEYNSSNLYEVLDKIKTKYPKSAKESTYLVDRCLSKQLT